MKTNRFSTLLVALLLGACATPLMAGNNNSIADASLPSYSIFGDLFKDIPKRHLELNMRWGFNNWGDSPFGAFGGTTGDAEASYYFLNLAISTDYPLVNASHFFTVFDSPAWYTLTASDMPARRAISRTMRL